MKYLLLLTTWVITTASTAQDCSNFFYLQDNKTVEMTITNRKGNVTGKNIYAVSNLVINGTTRTATVQSEFFDTKGKSLSKAVNNIRCQNGVMMMDMKMFIPAAQQDQIKSSAARAEEVFLEYPAAIKVGDNLKDGQFSMEFENNTGLKSSIEISITERKVEGRETVTTTAGTWECFKISANNKITNRIAGIGIPIKTTVTEWFAPGVGVVKTESALGKTEITAFE